MAATLGGVILIAASASAQTGAAPTFSKDVAAILQKFKNDMSLSQKEIDTIVAWVDAGALQGDPKDMPAPKPMRADNEWKGVQDGFGPPDNVASVNTGTANGPAAATTVEDLVNRRPQLMEWAIGKGYDLFTPGTGKLIVPGEKLSWDQHLHASGEEVEAGSEIALWLYPKGQEPTKRSYLTDAEYKAWVDAKKARQTNESPRQ